MLLDIMLAYIMLLSALFIAVCLYNACLFPFSILPLTVPLLLMQMLFVFRHFLGVVDIWFVYFIFYFASHKVLLICRFSLFYFHIVFVYVSAMCSQEK